MASLGLDPTPDAATTADPAPSLQDHIQTLTDLHGRLQTLRHVPTVLLRPPSASPLADFSAPFDSTIDREFAATFNSTPTHDFRALKDFQEMLRSHKVQEALRAARASEDTDQSELGLSFRRESRKQKQPQSPVGSPQPYVPSPPRSSSLFAPPEDDPPPMRAESLVEFVREFNRGDDGGLPKCRLAIWSRTQTSRDALKAGSSSNAGGGWKPQGGRLTSPVVLRFTIPDVLTAYMSLIFTDGDDGLIVESVTAFGPRERVGTDTRFARHVADVYAPTCGTNKQKLPHEQSDYLAFQGLSQHITKMILSHPRVPVQVMTNVLVSYRGLFVDRCTSCERVLSAEGHIPPVARTWVSNEAPATQSAESPGGWMGPGGGAAHGSGHWEARHATCLYN